MTQLRKGDLYQSLVHKPTQTFSCPISIHTVVITAYDTASNSRTLYIRLTSSYTEYNEVIT